MNDIKEHIRQISENTEDVLPMKDLELKVRRSLDKKQPLTIKYGVDPTAPDLHLGHAVALRKLRNLQDLGHQVLLLIGDFTALIGDPTERKTTRPQLTPEQVADNAKTYLDQAFKILDKDKTKIVQNSTWFLKMGFDGLLKVASKMTVARILERDDFEKRLKEGVAIGLHEMLYPLMQGYDSVELKNDIEIGGTDQKFNMHAGRDLQREYGQEPQVIITMPILEGVDGTMKMSKSLGNHVGLTDDPEEMFAKVMSIPDETPGGERFSMIIKYFKLATDLSGDEIDKITAGLSSGELHPVEQKRLLAKRIVTLYHSTDDAAQAEEIFDVKHKKPVTRTKTFSASGVLVDDLEAKKSIAPELTLSAGDLKNGTIWVIDLIRKAGFAGTNSDARRLVEQGAVRINGVTVASVHDNPVVTSGDLFEVGKRHLARLSLS